MTNHKNQALAARVLPLGEAAALVSFGTKISPAVHRSVRAFAAGLSQHPFRGMTEYVEAYTSVTVFYDPMTLCGEKLLNPAPDVPYSFQVAELYIGKLLQGSELTTEMMPRHVRIPVCYGGKYGPDLAAVAQYHKMSEKEVVAAHTGGDYLVYMIGFAPGFPYVGGLPPRLATPRRKSPRLVIPKGSVGIAGMQTGVYPIETPGGWQLIGRTPLELFRPDNGENPSLLQAGDRLEFYAISEQEYMDYMAEGSVPVQ